MTTGQFLLSTLAVFGAVVIVLVEGRSTIPVASLAAAVALIPSAVFVGGVPAAVVPLAGAVGATVAHGIARWSAERLPLVAGLDPLVPVIAPPDGLFGPRSVRMSALLFGLPATSWVSLNVELLGGASARGVVFAAGFIWVAGTARLLLARTVEDLAAGAAVVALASAVAWTAQDGEATHAEAALLSGFAVVAGAVAGWLIGRHHRGRVHQPIAEVQA